MTQQKNEEKSYDIVMDTLIHYMEKILPLLRKADIYEVYANPDGRIYTLSNKTGKAMTDIVLTPEEREAIIKHVAAVDTRIINEKNPEVDAKIPANRAFSMCRFHGDFPPVVEAPVFNIRKHSTTIYTLEDYLNQGTMTQEQYEIILNAIHSHKNIIVAGGTGSGKTTLINAVLAEIATSDDRIISIEDTNELQCKAKDYVALVASGEVTMSRCVKSTLRMTPRRIVVGEVRGEEALDLFTAWSTGHKGGCCTVHSNDAAQTLIRLVDMTSRVAVNPQPRTIANAIDVIIYIRNLNNKRWIEDIISIDDYDDVAKQFIWNKLDINSGARPDNI